MGERKRFFLLILIMAATSLIVVGIAISLLYRAAIQEERSRLVETAESQARLIEAVARFDTVYSKDYPEGAEKATLSQIVDAHKRYKGFGHTGEFTLARHEGDHMVFLLSHRHFDLENPKPVLFNLPLAEPMRRALSGLSGTVIGLDYRGENVLAAYSAGTSLTFQGKSYTAIEIQRIVDTMDIFIFPDVNPDGKAFNLSFGLFTNYSTLTTNQIGIYSESEFNTYLLLN